MLGVSSCLPLGRLTAIATKCSTVLQALSGSISPSSQSRLGAGLAFRSLVMEWPTTMRPCSSAAASRCTSSNDGACLMSAGLQIG